MLLLLELKRYNIRSDTQRKYFHFNLKRTKLKKRFYQHNFSLGELRSSHTIGRLVFLFFFFFCLFYIPTLLCPEGTQYVLIRLYILKPGNWGSHRAIGTRSCRRLPKRVGRRQLPSKRGALPPNSISGTPIGCAPTDTVGCIKTMPGS